MHCNIIYDFGGLGCLIGIRKIPISGIPCSEYCDSSQLSLLARQCGSTLSWFSYLVVRFGIWLWLMEWSDAIGLDWIVGSVGIGFLFNGRRVSSQLREKMNQNKQIPRQRSGHNTTMDDQEMNHDCKDAMVMAKESNSVEQRKVKNVHKIQANSSPCESWEFNASPLIYKNHFYPCSSPLLF